MPVPTKEAIIDPINGTTNVYRIEFLPNPAVTFEEHFNAQSEIESRRFRYIMEKLFGKAILVNGLNVFKAGSNIYVGTGALISGYYIVQNTAQRDLGVDPTTPTGSTNVTMRITESIHTFEDYPDEIGETYNGLKVSGPNRYWYNVTYQMEANIPPDVYSFPLRNGTTVTTIKLATVVNGTTTMVLDSIVKIGEFLTSSFQTQYNNIVNKFNSIAGLTEDGTNKSSFYVGTTSNVVLTPANYRTAIPEGTTGGLYQLFNEEKLNNKKLLFEGSTGSETSLSPVTGVTVTEQRATANSQDDKLLIQWNGTSGASYYFVQVIAVNRGVETVIWEANTPQRTPTSPAPTQYTYILDRVADGMTEADWFKPLQPDSNDYVYFNYKFKIYSVNENGVRSDNPAIATYSYKVKIWHEPSLVTADPTPDGIRLNIAPGPRDPEANFIGKIQVVYTQDGQQPSFNLEPPHNGTLMDVSGTTADIPANVGVRTRYAVRVVDRYGIGGKVKTGEQLSGAITGGGLTYPISYDFIATDYTGSAPYKLNITQPSAYVTTSDSDEIIGIRVVVGGFTPTANPGGTPKYKIRVYAGQPMAATSTVTAAIEITNVSVGTGTNVRPYVVDLNSPIPVTKDTMVTVDLVDLVGFKIQTHGTVFLYLRNSSGGYGSGGKGGRGEIV
jgi:hypothetical protein